MNSPVLGLHRGLGRYEKCHCFCIKNTAFFKNITSLFSTSLLQKWSISKIALKSSKMSLGQLQWTRRDLQKCRDAILSQGQALTALQLKMFCERFFGTFRIEMLKKSGTFCLFWIEVQNHNSCNVGSQWKNFEFSHWGRKMKIPFLSFTPHFLLKTAFAYISEIFTSGRHEF